MVHSQCSHIVRLSSIRLLTFVAHERIVIDIKGAKRECSHCHKGETIMTINLEHTALLKQLKEIAHDSIFASDSPIASDYLQIFYDYFVEDLDELIEPGENLWYQLEHTLDYSSPYFFEWLNSFSLKRILGVMEDEDDPNVEVLIWNDGSGPGESLRRSYVTYLAGFPLNTIRDYFDREEGIDIANEKLIIE